jgi:ectoine hydroxylase
MNLTEEQLDTYREQGLLIVKDVFSREEIELMKAEIQRLKSENHPTNLLEIDGKTMRALHGCHENSKIMSNLVRHPKLLIPAQQMLGGDVYVHQFKVSMKAAFDGDVWKWHQDFMYWHHEDGLPEPRAVTVAIYLNDVTDFNSPTWIVPRVHKEGLLKHRDPNLRKPSDPNRPGWHDNVVADFKYILEDDVVTRIADRFGIVSATGPAGTIFFFHASAPHASTHNLSPYERIVILVTYNSLDNLPRTNVPDSTTIRPQFLVNQNYSPLRSVSSFANILTE